MKELEDKSYKTTTAHIFPAFVPEYLGIEVQVLENYGINFSEYLTKTSDIIGENLTDFDIINNNFLDNPLKSQYITYIISCCFSDFLTKRKCIPDFVTSYSMGIYAALYHCRSIDFATGLMMIKEAYRVIENYVAESDCSMCAIGGLDKNDVTALIRSFQNDVFIINQNSEFSFLLSGNRHHLEQILSNARTIGALQTRMLPVKHPYHTPLLNKAAAEFEAFIEGLNIEKSCYNYISVINTRLISNEKEIRKELVKNLNTPFHWQATFTYLLNQKVENFIECGAGESLCRICRFIPGNFYVYNLKTISKIC